VSDLDALSPEERLVVTTVRDFVDAEVKPVVRELEHCDTYPHALVERMKELGVFGLAIPERYGGTPVSMPCFVLVTEELARGWMSLAGAMGGHTVVATLLTGFGTPEQRERHLPAMATAPCERRWR
jgi:alkylation response protein AidB-like acyl-CoA dehydrogenase